MRNATKRSRGRPKNLTVPKLMERDGVSRATVYRRIQARRKVRLVKAAPLGNGRDPLNQHPDGYYPTPPRGTYALLTVEILRGRDLGMRLW